MQNAGVEENVNFPPLGGQDVEWYGINQYFLFTLNPTWQANFRFEWLRDDDGARVGGPGGFPPLAALDVYGDGGFAGDFYEFTAGLNWRPHPNAVIRPEVRWDWYEGRTNGAGRQPFNDGASDDQFTAAVDLILTY